VEPALRRPALLLIHHDSDLLDLLTRVFEARGFAVAIAATAFQAMSLLEGEREYQVIIAAWDATNGLGADVYKWALRNRFHLRGQFVFLADEVAADFDRIVAGRCLTVPPHETEEIVRIAEAAARRGARLADMSEDELAWLDADRPTLLLADDDPMLLMIMSQLLGDFGFAVTPVESGNAAIAQLDRTDFDVVLLDWFMADGAGGEVYTWLTTYRPWLAERVVFITGGDADVIRKDAQGRPVMPKGQDSQALVRLLTSTARAHKHE
jgi:DNA-binding response OmpR family regulator